MPDLRATLAAVVAEHRQNVVVEPRRVRVKCDGDDCRFYAEGESYWYVVKVHDAHLVEVLTAALTHERTP